MPPLRAQHIMADLDRFVGNAPQHDDVTLMLLRANWSGLRSDVGVGPVFERVLERNLAFAGGIG